MKPLPGRLLQKLQRLFDFHQPQFHHLDCIDIVLENKLLLLISWDIVHASSICIRPGKIVYRSSTSAAICKLPFRTETVDIILRNVWRSKKISFRLHRVTLDQQTLLHLDGVIMKNLTFSGIQPAASNPSINFDKLQPMVTLVIPVPVINISFNQLQLNDYAP